MSEGTYRQELDAMARAKGTDTNGTPIPCQRCGEGNRWKGGMWCARCVAETCCVPKRGICAHGNQAIRAVG